jgi:hypothetical protein
MFARVAGGSTRVGCRDRQSLVLGSDDLFNPAGQRSPASRPTRDDSSVRPAFFQDTDWADAADDADRSSAGRTPRPTSQGLMGNSVGKLLLPEAVPLSVPARGERWGERKAGSGRFRAHPPNRGSGRARRFLPKPGLGSAGRINSPDPTHRPSIRHPLTLQLDYHGLPRRYQP